MSAAPSLATRSRSGRLFASPPPAVAIEIAGDRVAAVAFAGGTPPLVSAYAFEPLPAGLVVPSLNASNVADEAALVGALRSVLEKVAPRARRAALVLPDTVAKVSLVRFEKVPGRMQDLDQMIRWQVRKAAPFRIEDAQLSWVPGLGLPGGGREYLVTLARRDIVEGYERACDRAGVHAGLIDLATFDLINAVLPGLGEAGGDWLLVNVAGDYATLAVVRGPDLVFFRNRPDAAEADLADLVHQTAMYHEDRLGGGGFRYVLLAGAWMQGLDRAEHLRRALEERLGARVEPLDFRPAAALSDRIGVNPALLDALAAPAGVLLRERARRTSADAGRVA
ncbi:MAG TPA: pilus assembly protein PilM [Vicinamibacterales bacterium]|nr:pilus assembly protein PilM [Vicinamibacterales bacterium]